MIASVFQTTARNLELIAKAAYVADVHRAAELL
jgi:hypothetical protein